MIHMDRAFIELDFRTARATMGAPVGPFGASIFASGHQHVLTFPPGRLAPGCPRDKAHPLSRAPQRRRMHALIVLVEPRHERPATDVTPRSLACTKPLAHDFFQRRLEAVWGLALRFDRGREALPSVVLGTEHVFDGTFPKAPRLGNPPRRVLGRHHDTGTPFLIKDFLQAHDKLAAPQLNRFALRHI
jgi:hypothetical protein